MGAFRGAIVGGLGLVTLYNVSTGPTEGVATLASLPGRAAHWLISPNVPLIPDIAGVAISGSVAPGSSLSAPGSSSGTVHN